MFLNVIGLLNEHVLQHAGVRVYGVYSELDDTELLGVGVMLGVKPLSGYEGTLFQNIFNNSLRFEAQLVRG